MAPAGRRQRRPAGADGLPHAAPSEPGPASIKQPEYYSTIPTADVDGQPGEEVLVRFPDGMRAYKYTPPAGGGIDGGNWSLIARGGPFSDADGWTDPSLYLTVSAGLLNPSEPAVLWSRQPQPDDSVGIYGVNGSGWSKLNSAGIEGYGNPTCANPSCYLDLKANPYGLLRGLPGGTLVGRQSQGIDAFQWSGPQGFKALPGGALSSAAIFSDIKGLDCPFGNTPGDNLPGSNDCLSTSPWYYETLKLSDINGDRIPELMARANDGLRVKHYVSPGGTQGTWQTLPTLTDLAYFLPEFVLLPGLSSIQTANIDGQGGDEVLALDGTALQAWSYDASANAWRKLQPSAPLALALDPWLTHPEYYATIQTGDVDGDGRDDVIARGPFGIRTWFCDRRGTGGWERYLPDGYPQFSAAGQQAAFAALTTQAKTRGVIPFGASSVRDVWSAENAPQPSDLSQLQQGVLSLAGCSGPNPGNLPSFQACTPPAGSSGFDAADWTAVINQVLSEIFAAQQVLAHFTQVDNMRQSLFIAEGAELPAIDSDLQLQAAAANQAKFAMTEEFAETFQIIGSIAGVSAGPEGAALSVVGDIMSMLPSASPTATSTFQTTYAGLQAKFATMIGEMDKVLDAQSQIVRQDYGLLALVGQLRARGTWNPDAIGLKSAANQGFAVWVYQTLLPTMYARYVITNCTLGQLYVDCNPIAPGAAVIGGGTPNFTALSSPPSTGYPCAPERYPSSDDDCNFNSMPDALANLVWGPLTPTCDYQPGNPNTVWTFGCGLGVTAATSVGANSPDWQFTTYTGHPEPETSCCSLRPVAIARDVPGRRATAGAVRAGASRRATSEVRLAGRITVRRVRLTRLKVVHERMLFDRGRRRELVRRRSGRAMPAITLKRVAAGVFAGRAPGGPRVRLQLRRTKPKHRLAFTLRMSEASVPRGPAACFALPASISLATAPIELETRLRFTDGRRTVTVRLRHRWRCRRDGKGNVNALHPIRRKPLATRPGLAVLLRGPRSLRPGTTATYRIRLRNRRSGRNRLRSSLWHVTVRGLRSSTTGRSERSWRIAELRRGRSRTFRLRVRVPATASGRYCTTAVAGADAARGAQARICATVRPAARPLARCDRLAPRGRSRRCARGKR